MLLVDPASLRNTGQDLCDGWRQVRKGLASRLRRGCRWWKVEPRQLESRLICDTVARCGRCCLGCWCLDSCYQCDGRRFEDFTQERACQQRSPEMECPAWASGVSFSVTISGSMGSGRKELGIPVMTWKGEGGLSTVSDTPEMICWFVCVVPLSLG